MNRNLILIVFLLILNHALALADEVRAEGTGIRLPFFNDNGTLSHQLLAKKGYYVTGKPRFEDVEILYFDPEDKEKVIWRITAKEAIHDAEKGRLYGEGKVSYLSADFNVRGLDYEINLDSSVLTIMRNCFAEGSSYNLSSALMEIDYSRGKDGKAEKEISIEKLTAKKNVKLINKGDSNYPFDTAYTQIAEFNGKTGVINFPEEIRIIKDGQEGFLGKLVIHSKSDPITQ